MCMCQFWINPVILCGGDTSVCVCVCVCSVERISMDRQHGTASKTQMTVELINLFSD